MNNFAIRTNEKRSLKETNEEGSNNGRQSEVTRKNSLLMMKCWERVKSEIMYIHKIRVDKSRSVEEMKQFRWSRNWQQNDKLNSAIYNMRLLV